MKREDISKVFEGATDEQITAILDINSADIGKAKGDFEAVKANLETAQNTIATMTTELNNLKESNATAEDWKQKFEALKANNDEKERLAKEAQAKAEKEAAILDRYNAVCVGQDGKPLEFAHEAIKVDYLRKFTEAIESAEYTGKSDADIFHSLTKDDAAAFKGVQVKSLYGGNPGGGMATDASVDNLSKMSVAEYIAARKEMKG